MAEFDDRSEKNLATLRPKAQPHFRALLRALKAYTATVKGLDAKIISGNRTWAEQDALYAKGRTAPGPKVTNARGGQSNHNYQIAVDIGLFSNGRYLTDSPHYRKLGPLGEALGLEWGGRWRTIPDTPHYQIKTGHGVSTLWELVRTKGWVAIDALIPTVAGPARESVAAPGLTPAPVSAPAPDNISVSLDHGHGAEKLSLDAWFVDSQAWVAIPEWADYFGGTVVEKNGKFFLALNGQIAAMPTRLIGDRPAVRFADINAVLGWNYSFDGLARPRVLTVHAHVDT